MSHFTPLELMYLLQCRYVSHPITFEDFLAQHKPNSCAVHPAVKREIGNTGTKWYCYTKVCHNLRKSKCNSECCMAPECTNDLHHYRFKPRMSYWCPVCQEHSSDEKRCVNECSNNKTHWLTSDYLLHKTECFAKECLLDQSHTDKSDHEICEKCLKFHKKCMNYCSECNKCYPVKIHCKDPRCVSDPHHVRPRKSGYEFCSNCLKCHKQDFRFCSECKVCFSENYPHCESVWCRSNRHHHVRKYFTNCNACKNDPHHSDQLRCIDSCYKSVLGTFHGEGCSVRNKYCEKCKKCHNPHLHHCLECKECFDGEHSVHCVAKECAEDRHHTSSLRCTDECHKSSIGILHGEGCTVKNKYCEKCDKCHKFEYCDPKYYLNYVGTYSVSRELATFYCDVCKMCHNKKKCCENHCMKCSDDPHHFTKKNMLFCNQCHECHDKSFVFCPKCNVCHKKLFSPKYCETCKSCHEQRYSVHCLSPHCANDPHHELNHLTVGSYPDDGRFRCEETTYWCNTCELHWNKYYKHNPNKCNFQKVGYKQFRLSQYNGQKYHNRNDYLNLKQSSDTHNFLICQRTFQDFF